MGANVSTTVDKATNIVENVTKTSCEMRQAVDQSIENIRLDLTDTSCDNLSFTNRVKLVGTCNLDAVASALAEASADLTAEQTTALGIGINVNSTVRDRTNIIRNIIEQRCSSEQLAAQSIKGVTIIGRNLSCNQLQFLNEADVTTQCVMTAVMDAVTNDNFKAASKQTVDWFSGLSKYGLYIVLILGIVFGGRLLLSARQNQQDSTAPATPAPAVSDAEGMSAQLFRRRRRL